MSKSIFQVLCVLASLCAGSVAMARGGGSGNGVILTANAFVYNTTVEVPSGAASESNISIYDIKMGYLSASGLYWGGLYTVRNQSGDTDQAGHAVGGSLGYFGANGFYLKGHYILQATQGDYDEGTGVQGDFGYLAGVSGSFYVGVELTYRSIEYKKQLSAPIAGYKVSQLFPMLTVGFVF